MASRPSAESPASLRKAGVSMTVRAHPAPGAVPARYRFHIRSEGSGSRRAGARVARTAAIAAADIEDARRARAPHWRRQALHCDCGAEDAARRIEAGPDLANLPLARMPLFDSQRGVDAP